MFKPNDCIGPYKLIEPIGKGTFSQVWLARKNVYAANPIALKIPSAQLANIDDIRKESLLWVDASGHINVVPIHEAHEYDGQFVIASEYMPDGTLKDWLHRPDGRTPSVAEAIEMTRGILAGLAYLHAKEITHRDLKPANIMLQGETPRLTDFGLSRVLHSIDYSSNAAGTPAYMPPEAFEGKLDKQSDLWSVGVILYEMLSGRRPFPGDDWNLLRSSILSREPEPLPNSVPEWLRQAVASALAKDLEARFKTAEKMRAALVEPCATLQPKPQLAPNDSVILAEQTTIKPARLLRPVDHRPKPAGLDKVVLAKCYIENINGVPMEMILVPGNKFQMGSLDSEGDDSERPRHEVKVPPFYCSKFPVTQKQWQAVMKNNPSAFKGADLPVETVSWNDAKAFCSNLLQLTGKAYRLPSEAEWEYACRAGSTSKWYFGDDEGLLKQYAWYDKNSESKTHPVGQRRPNAFGLYDMHGNVWEWCEDTWHNNYDRAPKDGSSWLSGGESSYRVLRGSSWGLDEWFCRAATRYWDAPGDRSNLIGFRVVWSAPTR
jgi:eukaryotic-like serine/threonine-protein kinase